MGYYPEFIHIRTELQDLGEIEFINWIDEKHKFVQFKIRNKGIGVYYVEQKKILVQPGYNDEISVDYKMELVFYKKNWSTDFTKINFKGEEVQIKK